VVFDQNRIKPKPQYFVVQNTVFIRFLVRRYMADVDVCACLSPAKWPRYRSIGTLSSTHSLRTAAAFMLCSLPFPSPLPYAPHRAHGLVAWSFNADTVFVGVFETVEQWTSLSVVCAQLSLQTIATRNKLCTENDWRLFYSMSPMTRAPNYEITLVCNV